MAEVIRHPSPEYPIQHIARKLGENEELDKFVKELCEEIKRAKTDRKFLEDDWEVCEKCYWATNDAKRAGSRDSQLDFTITHEICKDASANLKNPIFSQDTVFMAQGRPGFKQMAAETDALLDWMCDQFKVSSFVNKSLRQAQIFTKAVAKVGWQYTEEKVKFWGEDEMTGEATEQEQTITRREGAYPHTVDPRKIHHPIPTVSIEEARWIAEEFELDLKQVQREKDRGFYREDLDPKAVGDSSKDPKNDPSELATAHGRESVGENAQRNEFERVNLMECYTCFEEREVILWLDVDRDTWVAAVENFFQSKKRPYATWSWNELEGSIDGKSLVSMLEPGHRAYCAIMNILLDHGSRSVEPLVIALKELGLSEYLDEGRLGPGLAEVERPIVEDLERGIKVVDLLSGNPMFLAELLGKIEKHMRDTASIPAMFRGEELAERPTATGTASIMEKAMQPLYDLATSYFDFLNDVARMMYARYRQFFPQSMQVFLQSQGEGGEMVAKTFSFPAGYWEDQVLIETKVNSQTMSKSVKKQEALAMIDKLPQQWQAFAAMGEAATSGMPISILAGQFLEVGAILLKMFYTEFEVPEVRDVLDVDGAKMAGEAVAQVVGQLQGIIEQQASIIADHEAQILDLGGALPEPMGGAPGGGGGPGQPQGAPGMGGGGAAAAA